MDGPGGGGGSEPLDGPGGGTYDALGGGALDGPGGGASDGPGGETFDTLGGALDGPGGDTLGVDAFDGAATKEGTCMLSRTTKGRRKEVMDRMI